VKPRLTATWPDGTSVPIQAEVRVDDVGGLEVWIASTAIYIAADGSAAILRPTRRPARHHRQISGNAKLILVHGG